MKSERKKEWARNREYKGKRVRGEQPRRRKDRPIIFKPWALILKRRRQKRKYGIEVGK